MAWKSVKNVLDSFQEEAEKKKNQAVDQVTSKLSETMMDVGQKLKNKLNLGGLLAKFNSLMDLLNNLPFGSKLSALLKNFINSQISSLKRLASETAASTFRALKHMATAAINRLVDTAMSHLALTDEMYLIGIKALYAIGSNVSYKNNYARQTAIKMDFAKTLEWIDDKIGMRYSLIESKPSSNASSVLSTVSGKSCINIWKYVFDILKAENQVVVSNVKNFEAQIKTQKNLIKGCEAAIEACDEEFTKEETTETRRDELTVMIALERKNIQLINDTIKSLEKEKRTWDNYDYKYRKLLAQQFKKLLTYSVGNFNTDKVREYIYDYNIKPAWFGDYDPDFNGAFKFTKGDVDTMAPFYKGAGFNKNIREELGDTRLVQTSKLPKYITLRNIYLKYIYILMNSVNIYGRDNQLSSQVLYERLCYNTMDFLTQLADEALGMLIEDGLGRLGIDVLLGIESAIYDYTKTFEGTMKTPTQKKYIQLMSYSQEMPVPLVPIEDSSPDYSDLNPTTNKLTPSELKNVLQYYLKQISKKDKYLPYYELFKLVKEKYDLNNDNSVFYQKYIVTYFSLTGCDPSFDSVEFFGNIDPSIIVTSYITVMDHIYYKKYQKSFNVTDDSEIIIELNEIFKKNFEYLKNFAIEQMVNNMTDAEVYSNLLYIYITLGEYATKPGVSRELNAEILKFLRKHYTEAAYTLSFYIQAYLSGLDLLTRRVKLKEILKDLEEQLVNNELFKWLKENTDVINKVLITIYPSYSLIIKIEQGADIDINDKDTINRIEEEYQDYFLSKVMYKDFDNKVWQLLTETLGENLDHSIEDIKPPKYLDYVVFYNTDEADK